LYAVVRILAISGSLSQTSANSRLLQRSADTTNAVEVCIWEGLGQLPYFSPDAEANEQVAELRRGVAGADVVWFCTPEYAGGMPGALKNALDWLVGTGELYGKRVVVVSAAPSSQRGGNARRWVEDVVRMQGAEVIDSFSVAVPPGAEDAVVDAAVEQTVGRVLLGLQAQASSPASAQK
jgi:chromate reductase